MPALVLSSSVESGCEIAHCLLGAPERLVLMWALPIWGVQRFDGAISKLSFSIFGLTGWQGVLQTVVLFPSSSDKKCHLARSGLAWCGNYVI